MNHLAPHPVLIDIPQGQDEETLLDEEPVPPPVLFADLSDVEDDTDLRPHTISRPAPMHPVPPSLHRLQRNRFYAPVIKEPRSSLYLAVGLMFEKSEHVEKIMCVFVR
jgi:hypothetical protein